MSKDWPYAKMSKEASQNGGPEKYKANLRQEGRNQNTVATIVGLLSAIVGTATFVANIINKNK